MVNFERTCCILFVPSETVSRYICVALTSVLGLYEVGPVDGFMETVLFPRSVRNLDDWSFDEGTSSRSGGNGMGVCIASGASDANCVPTQ